MVSKASTSRSATNCIEPPEPVTGYSLKKHTLKTWIYANNHTQPYVARRMNISTDEFKRKLNDHGLFNEQQLRRLIRFMGAEAAFDVIYFPTKEEKRKVHKAAIADQRKRRVR